MADPPRPPLGPQPPSAVPPPGPPPWFRRESEAAASVPLSRSGLPPELVAEAGERRRWRWWLAALLAVLIYLGLAVATAVQPVRVTGLSLTVPIPGLPPARLFGLPNEPFTVLVVGLDVRPSQDGPSRTDSILLLHIDPGEDRAGLLSIPRDTMMQVPTPDGEIIEERVNTALVYNWSSDDPTRGLRALKETLERNLGLSFDHYLVFDQRSAEKVIDAAGGVTIENKSAFGQDNYSDDDVTVVPQFFPEGKLHLNGYSAVAYGRIRDEASDAVRANDLDRIQRQQQVARALLEGLASPGSAFRWRKVWNAYNDAVETDLGLRQSAGIFALLNRAGGDRLVTRSLGDAAVACSSCSASLLLLNPMKTALIIGEAFGDKQAGQVAAERLVSAGVAIEGVTP